MFKNLRIVSKFTRQMSYNRYITWETPKSKRFFRRKGWMDKVSHKPIKKNVKKPDTIKDIPDKKNNYPVDMDKTNDWKNNINYRDIFLL